MSLPAAAEPSVVAVVVAGNSPRICVWPRSERGQHQLECRPIVGQPRRQEGLYKIAMTSPVVQQSSGQENIVSFVMPAGMTLEALPIPSSSKVSLREVPEQLVAVSRFSGRWTHAVYIRHVAELESSIAESGFTSNGSPRFARFDPPWTPWFMRRNEIQIPIAIPTQ